MKNYRLILRLSVILCLPFIVTACGGGSDNEADQAQQERIAELEARLAQLQDPNNQSAQGSATSNSDTAVAEPEVLLEAKVDEAEALEQNANDGTTDNGGVILSDVGYAEPSGEASGTATMVPVDPNANDTPPVLPSVEPVDVSTNEAQVVNNS